MRGNTPLVSVIIPNYNHQNYLLERIDSVLNQSFQEFEIIILDDYSTDNSVDVLTSYDNVRIYKKVFNEKNSGSTFKQWEKGIDLARGEYIWIAESDDIADNFFLEKMVEILENNQRIALAYCQSYEIDSNSIIVGDWINWTSEFQKGKDFTESFCMDGQEFIDKYLLFKNVIPNASAVVFRKKSYELVKGVSKACNYLKALGDWFLWMKLATVGDIFYSHEKLNYFRRHQSSVIARIKSNDDALLFKINENLVLYSLLGDYFCENNLYGNLKKIRKIYFLDLTHVSIKFIFRLKFNPFFKRKELLSIGFIKCFLFRIIVTILLLMKFGFRKDIHYDYLLKFEYVFGVGSE